MDIIHEKYLAFSGESKNVNKYRMFNLKNKKVRPHPHFWEHPVYVKTDSSKTSFSIIKLLFGTLSCKASKKSYL